MSAQRLREQELKREGKQIDRGLTRIPAGLGNVNAGTVRAG